MSDHAHIWEPNFDLGMGQYRCACGATGYRCLVEGVIQAHKEAKGPRRRADVRDGTGWKKPSLDDYEGGRRRR